MGGRRRRGVDHSDSSRDGDSRMARANLSGGALILRCRRLSQVPAQWISA